MDGDVGQITEHVGAALTERRMVAPGSTVVLVSITNDLSQRYANYLKLHRVG